MQSRLGRSSFVSFRIIIQMLSYFAPHSPEISYIPSTLNSKLKASMSLQKASLISSAVTFFGSICLSSEFERLSSLVWVLSERFRDHLIILSKGAATFGTQPPPKEQDSSQPLPGLPWLDPPRTILRGRAESRTWSSNSPRPWKSSRDQRWLICWEKLMCRDAKYLVQDPFLNSGTPTWHSLASLHYRLRYPLGRFFQPKNVQK